MLVCFSFPLQNIFLTDSGTVKVGDFGSACTLNRYSAIFFVIQFGVNNSAQEHSNVSE